MNMTCASWALPIAHRHASPKTLSLTRTRDHASQRTYRTTPPSVWERKQFKLFFCFGNLYQRLVSLQGVWRGENLELRVDFLVKIVYRGCGTFIIKTALLWPHVRVACGDYPLLSVTVVMTAMCSTAAVAAHILMHLCTAKYQNFYFPFSPPLEKQHIWSIFSADSRLMMATTG